MVSLSKSSSILCYSSLLIPSKSAGRSRRTHPRACSDRSRIHSGNASLVEQRMLTASPQCKLPDKFWIHENIIQVKIRMLEDVGRRRSIAGLGDKPDRRQHLYISRAVRYHPRAVLARPVIVHSWNIMCLNFVFILADCTSVLRCIFPYV